MVGCVRVKLYCAVVVPHQVIWDTLPQTQNINLSIQSAYCYSKGILVNFIVVLLRLPVMIQNLEWNSEAYQVLGKVPAVKHLLYTHCSDLGGKV